MPNLEYIDIKRLTLLDRNPRKITKQQFEKLCESIKSDPSFLECRPLLVSLYKDDGKMVVYAGNQRLRAAKKLKMTHIWCSVDVDLTPEIIKSRIVKDNKSFGEFDYDILFADFEIDMLESAGFTPEELTGDFGDAEEDAVKKEKKAKVCPKCGCEI